MNAPHPPELQTLAAKPKILVVDDDPIIVRTLHKALAELGTVYFASNGPDALARVAELNPDLVLLDAEMPGMSGLQVCQTLREDPQLADLPIIFVTRHTETSMEQAALDVGAVDFVTKPLRPGIIATRCKTHLRLKKATDDLRRLADVDGLTGLSNRRALQAALDREWALALRTGEPLSLLMIDVDHFKRYNDHYGHPQGDTCLRQIAALLHRTARRPTDVAARYGGEEFVLLLPRTDEEGARFVAQGILAELQAAAWPHEPSELGGIVSVSVGLSTAPAAAPADYSGSAKAAGSVNAPASESHPQALRLQSADLVQAADSALYAAKAAGRARLAFEPLQPGPDQTGS